MVQILTPEETREHSIFTLLGREGAGAWRWLVLIVLAATAWLGGVGFLGQFRPTQVSRLVETIAPLEQVYWVSVALATVIALAAVVARRWALGWAAATVAVYLGGLYVSGFFFHYLPPGIEIPFTSTEHAWRFALSRLWFAGPIAIALAILWFCFRKPLGAEDLALGIGNWLVRSRDVSAKEAPASWLAKLFGGYLLFVLLFAAFVQFPVGFAPILSGAILTLLPAILIAAAANAAAEEVIYRGFIQPAFISYAGAGAGLWVQGLFFGIIHWGLSVGVLAALPTSLLIGLGSVVWGKAAYETRGLSWTIVAHFMIDVAIMAAYFVPR
jgi:membrane protease YdiL (CAAX protease family)